MGLAPPFGAQPPSATPPCATPLYAHPLFQQLTHGAWRPGGLELTRHGLSLCAFAAGERVADVGCGGGATLEYMQSLGLQAVGLDSAPLPAHGPMICADAAHLPLKGHSLDGIVCECVLSLVDNTKDVLVGFARVLRPGGTLLLADVFVHDSVTTSPQRAKQSSQDGALPRQSHLDGALPRQSHLDGALPRRACLDGALPRRAVERALEKAGFRIACFEDHSAVLRPLAAQLLWHGLSCTEHGLGHGRASVGYGIWIGQKNPEK